MDNCDAVRIASHLTTCCTCTISTHCALFNRPRSNSWINLPSQRQQRYGRETKWRSICKECMCMCSRRCRVHPTHPLPSLHHCCHPIILEKLHSRVNWRVHRFREVARKQRENQIWHVWSLTTVYPVRCSHDPRFQGKTAAHTDRYVPYRAPVQVWCRTFKPVVYP